MPTARTTFHPLRVRDVERLCDDAAAVSFEVPPELTDAYRFRPGQSLTIRREVAGREERRSYSICSPAGSAPRVGVRVVPDGVFSTWLVDAVRPGDVVDVQPPSGRFGPDADAAGHHVLVAAGSGITPMVSIASSLLARDDTRVSLLYGNRTTRSVMFVEELADLKDAHGPRFDLVHVLSREPREVELFNGRLDADRVEQILRALVPVDGVAGYWLCGPLAMVEQVRDRLVAMGVPAERVHVELFYVDAPPPPLHREDAVLDGPTTRLTVTLDGRSSELVVPRDRPVLDAAQAARGDLPFACKGGVCGTCRARVTDGEVEMRRNYALEQAEVDAGFVLTCQAVPLGDAVAVDYDA